jgi:type IV pilus assembly protein PilC
MTTQENNKIPLYIYQGLDKNRQTTRGEINARSLVIAKAELLKQGITIQKIYEKKPSLFKKRKQKIGSPAVTMFTRQLSTMINSGIPLVQSFDIIAKGQSNPSMVSLIEHIKKEVESGTSLSESLKKHPQYFNELFCNLVDAGEKSGSLDIMLSNLATYKEKVESIKKKIKKALTYPIAVLVIAFIVTAGLLIFVVPQFESLFKGFGADLPALTRLVVDLSDFFQKYWYLIFGVIGILLYSFLYFLGHSPEFARRVDSALLRLPIIGAILQKAAIARFSRTLAITFAAGLPLVDALKSVSGATGNILYANATNRIREEISSGHTMQQSLTNTKLFPNMVIQMVAIGEESGQLELMLSKVADFYEEEVDNAVDSLSSLIEPIIMSILGILVGGLVVAMYLPIFKLGSVV